MDRKKINKIVIIAAGLFVLGIPTYIYFHQVSYQLREGTRVARQSFDPYSKSGQAAIHSRILSNNYFSIQAKADQLMKQGQYDQAIIEFRKAVDFARQNNQSEWTARSGLSEAYEKAGRFDEAIKEIDWLIAQKPREEVLQGFIKRKDSMQNS